MTVAQAQREIDSAEFSHWIEFFQLEGFGAPYEDMRAGMIASMLANINRDTKAHPEPFGVLHFVPWSDQKATLPDEPILLEDPQEQSDLILAAIFGVAKK